MGKKPMKPRKPAAAAPSRPAPVPEGAARSASYAISVAVHILVLLVIFFSAQFIKSTPTPEPQKKFEEVLLQFDMGVPGSDGMSVMETLNPDADSPIDNPDQGSPDAPETQERTAPRQQSSTQPDPRSAQPRPQSTQHPNPAHRPEPASNKPNTTPQPNAGNNPNPNSSGGSDPATNAGTPDGSGTPSNGTSPDDTGRPSLPGTLPAQPGWCRTKDDQNNPGATYSYKGGTYRCNCTLGQSVTCRLVK
jgi:hypothetical protein